MNRSNILKNISLVVSSIILTYLVLEAAFTYLENRTPPDIYWVLTDAETFIFDPVSGFRLTTTPTTRSRISYGIVEYVGTYYGNNQGFPDQEDFYPQRANSTDMRYVVLGDSFSHAQFNPHNWPDFVEDTAASQGIGVELLNFSLDGTGLANWWSILRGIVVAEDYEIDGVIFAVFADNLYRPFTIVDTQHGEYRVGRMLTWNPERFPATREEALQVMEQVPLLPLSLVVSEEDFPRALRGEIYPKKRFGSFLQERGRQMIRKLSGAAAPVQNERRLYDLFYSQPPEEQSHRTMMIEDIARMIEANNWEAVVIYIPTRTELITKNYDRFYKEDAQMFAKAINASFYDGADAFYMMTEEQVREHWLPYDGHWNVKGSDRFGRFVMSKVGPQLYASHLK